MLIGDSQPSLLTGGVADQQIGWPLFCQRGNGGGIFEGQHNEPPHLFGSYNVRPPSYKLVYKPQ